MLAILNNNKFRYACSLLVAVTVSIALGFYQTKYSMVLIPLTAVFVMQASIGNALYHGARKGLFLALLVMLAALLLPSKHFFMAVITDVLFGTVIGIAANVLILPRRADIEFREKIEPVFVVYQQYFSNMIDSMLHKAILADNAQMEIVLHGLPGWVHETGFDAGLKLGYQFFLVKLEQLGDILFAMHHLARHPFEDEFVARMHQPLEDCQRLINLFFQSIIQVLQLKKLEEGVDDFIKEIDFLEKEFYTLAPANLELLDFRMDYVRFAEFIYCLRDLRSFILRLGEALRK